MKRHVALEDVLDAFSMEEDVSTQTLERYLRVYPQYVEALSDLFHEMNLMRLEADASSEVDIESSEPSQEAEAIEEVGKAEEPLFSKDNIKRAATSLRVSRTFLTGFRDRLIVAATIPNGVLAGLARALGRSEEVLKEHLQGRPSIGTAVAFKSDEQPSPPGQVSFETYLEDFPIEAGQLAPLMASDGRD